MPLSGTFRARFSILSITGSPFSTLGVGDNAFHYYADATNSGVINFHLFGNCFYLDGSLVPMDYNGLPAGFTPSGMLALTSPNTNNFGFIDALQVPADATGSIVITYGVYGPKTISVSGNLSPSDITVVDANSLLSILTFQCAIQHVALLGNAAEVWDTIDISGNYVIQSVTVPEFEPVIRLKLTHLMD